MGHGPSGAGGRFAYRGARRDWRHSPSMAVALALVMGVILPLEGAWAGPSNPSAHILDQSGPWPTCAARAVRPTAVANQGGSAASAAMASPSSQAATLAGCGSMPDGTPCNDVNACTSGETCQGGICQAPVSFAPSVGSPFSVGFGPDSVAAGDLDGDGKLDLAVANLFSVMILLGNGTGGFTPAPGSPIFGPFAGPTSIAIGSFNGDGNPDLAVTNYNSSLVTILIGVGAGTFIQVPAPPIGAGFLPHSVAVGNLNGDGRLDLAVANEGSNDVTILLGNGVGGFVTAGAPAAAGTSPEALAAGDLNGDGALDLAVANSGSGDVTILLGNGAGGFFQAPGSPVGAGMSPQFVAVSDLNADGTLDLAVANMGSSNVTILLGNGSGGFSQAPGSPVGAGSSPQSVVAGDLNGDGALDLAVANSGSADVTILLGDGAAGFSQAATSPVGVGSMPISLACADYNVDGRLDLAVANFGGSTIEILLNSATAVACNDSNSCTSDSCDPPTGSCVFTSNNANSCSDGNACTTEVCFGGLCTPSPVLCDDNNVCTSDSCSFPIGCAYFPNTNPCDDGNPCTTGDVCNMGVCIAGSADISVMESDSANPIVASQPLTLTIKVKNAGASAAASVTVNGATPANTSFESLTAPVGWNCSTPAVGGAGPITCMNNCMDPFVTDTFTLAVTVNSCIGDGALNFVMAGSSASPDPNPFNNTATDAILVVDEGICDDLDCCTAEDHCQGPVCAGGSPTSCDDCNDCSQDMCLPAAGCSHTDSLCGVVAPITTPTLIPASAEVHGLTLLANKTTLSWLSLGTGVYYDVPRGLVSGLPVGPGGGDESCLGASISGTVCATGICATVSGSPTAGTAFWYLVRGKDSCAAGSYGLRSNGAQIVTTTCAP